MDTKQEIIREVKKKEDEPKKQIIENIPKEIAPTVQKALRAVFHLQVQRLENLRENWVQIF